MTWVIVCRMNDSSHSGAHSAEAAALGFYYQAFYALLALLQQTTDNAAVSVEQLDDVQLATNGQTLLYQLKHSMSEEPAPISVKSRSLWRTIKAWIDVLPELSLPETTLHLLTVGSIAPESHLETLLDASANRAPLVHAMVAEAVRVLDARVAAKAAGENMPYADRADGCVAFLQLNETERFNLMSRVIIKRNSPNIAAIEGLISSQLTMLPSEQRAAVAAKLVEWWERQVVYSLCGKRDRLISRLELQRQYIEIVAEIDQDKLSADFELLNPPADYQPDGMLTRQINLVNGRPSDLSKAIREEWRAREQRSKWIGGNPGLATTVGNYDEVLKEHWWDRHSSMKECEPLDVEGKALAGLNVLRWAHEEAPRAVRPIDNGWTAPYYVRGSLQILSVGLKVGWHPEYKERLKEEK
jgi:hypothetical protein